MTEHTRDEFPIILIRGFGGLDVQDERQSAYQGFNEGTVYLHKRGDNRIYEGLVLRLIKNRKYADATNLIRYGDKQQMVVPEDALVADFRVTHKERNRSFWVYRYYDIEDRKIETYGSALVDLIEHVKDISGALRVNIIAHSMGGLIVRHALQVNFPSRGMSPEDHINRIVTLGTPHQGISFQLLRQWLAVDASNELEAFNPEGQADPGNPASVANLPKYFDPGRILTVVGTNYRTYGVFGSSAANRIFSVSGEYGPRYNRSDGLVKQTYAQLPSCHVAEGQGQSYRTFVHKCHGGHDSLITSREAFEIADRFFHGDLELALSLRSASIAVGGDVIGKPEYFVGVSIKPRRTDFELFHQSKEAENCYGPYSSPSLDDVDVAFPPEPNGVLWRGFLDTAKAKGADIVFRLHVYIGERDALGVFSSDDEVLSKQYFVRATWTGRQPMRGLQLAITADRRAEAAPQDVNDWISVEALEEGWRFVLDGEGVELEMVLFVSSRP